MKKLMLIAAIIAVITLPSQIANAQGLYVNVGAGYGLPLASQNMGTDQSSNSIEVVRTSLGKGFNAGVAFGYMFNENIGAELGVNYLIGGKTTITDNSSSNNAPDVQTIKGSMLRINPAIKVTFGETVKPYAKLGLVIGVAGKITQTNEENSGAPLFPLKTEMTTVYTGGASVGISGALGVDFMINETIGIFAEIGAVAQSYAPSRSEITRLDVNGAQQVSTLNTHDRETEYVTSYDPTAPDNDDSVPDKALKMYTPFSSWGLNLGVHFAFGGN